MIAPRIGFCLFAAALLLGACGGDDTDASNVTVPAETSTSEPSTTTTESTTTTTEDPKAAVEAAFYAQWDAFVEIVSAPDPADPLIDRHFADGARSAVLDGVSKLLSQGQAFRLPDDESKFDPRIVEIDLTSASTATVFECTVEGLVLYEVSSNTTVNEGVANYERRNDFELRDGRWVVVETIPQGEGEPGCDDL